ncbi:MAG: DUF1573 domain-containing protein [Candidatus Lernaella stagnicola]|nr:DUF1573 domain-containing protein [Candidatus Lernaella stagnicola]
MAFAAPKIIFESEVHQFEKIESGTEIPAEFLLHNEGDDALVIEELKVTCDCTEVSAEPKVIPPGGEGTIFVVLDTSYRVGELDKEVVVVTNDPARPEITLHIKGTTYLPLIFKPSPLFFDSLHAGQKAFADVTLMNTGKKPITVKKLLASEPDVELAVSGKGDTTVELPHTLESGDYLWVRVTLQINNEAKGSINRQISAVADPAPVTPLILKIQGNFPSEAKGQPQ